MRPEISSVSSVGSWRSGSREPGAPVRWGMLYGFSVIALLSHILLDQYGGEVPLQREALQSLPGVGRKTASVVLNELGIEPAIAVDTHVFRVSHRLKLSTGKTPDQVEAELMSKVPEQYLETAHHLLILHGRYICVARKPKCLECPVAALCPSRDLFV